MRIRGAYIKTNKIKLPIWSAQLHLGVAICKEHWKIPSASVTQGHAKASFIGELSTSKYKFKFSLDDRRASSGESSMWTGGGREACVADWIASLSSAVASPGTDVRNKNPGGGMLLQQSRRGQRTPPPQTPDSLLVSNPGRGSLWTTALPQQLDIEPHRNSISFSLFFHF